MNIHINHLLKKYNVPTDETEIKKILTHHSFSNDNNNSRLVFLGQFHFKGLVAQWIYEHIGGSGMQLQQFLGNITSPKFIENLFNKWQFSKIRIAENFQNQSLKHIFVYALLGYISEYISEEELKKFIHDEFILPSQHLLPDTYKAKNRWDQFVFLCKQYYDCKPKISIEVSEEKIQTIKILVDNKIFSEHSSISFKYAKKKAINLALKKIQDFLEEKMTQDPLYQKNELIRLEKEEKLKTIQKEIDFEKHLARNHSHSERMKLKRKLAKIKAEEEDKKRRESKQIAKEKSSKSIRTVYRTYTSEEIANMSNAKRRNLQDRGIIPKGI